MKRHPFTSHPHDDRCWRCDKPRTSGLHKYVSVFYRRGQKPVVCLSCGSPLVRAAMPAWHFLIGPGSTEWKEIWCPNCHAPHKYRRPVPKIMRKYPKRAIEFRLIDDDSTGRTGEGRV